MPPNSPSVTLVWRIASSSEVLPWSTWPITVTTGGRVTASPAATSSLLFDRGFDVEGYILNAITKLAGNQRGGVRIEHLV